MQSKIKRNWSNFEGNKKLMLDLEENLKLLDNLTQKINKLEETTNIEALKSELSDLLK